MTIYRLLDGEIIVVRGTLRECWDAMIERYGHLTLAEIVKLGVIIA